MNNSPFNWSGKPSSFVNDKDKNKFNGINISKQHEPVNSSLTNALFNNVNITSFKKKEPVTDYNLSKTSKIKDKTYQLEIKTHHGN